MWFVACENNRVWTFFVVSSVNGIEEHTGILFIENTPSKINIGQLQKAVENYRKQRTTLQKV